MASALPDVLQAKDIKEFLGISQSLTYNLMNSEGFPTVKINTRMVVYRDAFLKWFEDSAGKKVSVGKKSAM